MIKAEPASSANTVHDIALMRQGQPCLGCVFTEQWERTRETTFAKELRRAGAQERQTCRPSRVNLNLLPSNSRPEWRVQSAPILFSSDNLQRALAAAFCPTPDSSRSRRRSPPPACRANLCSKSICLRRALSGILLRSAQPALSSGAGQRIGHV